MYLLSFDPAVPQSWHIPKRNNNRCPHKNWQMNVFSSIIHKGQSWKQLKYLSTDEQISKYRTDCMVYPCKEAYFLAMERNEEGILGGPVVEKPPCNAGSISGLGRSPHVTATKPAEPHQPRLHSGAREHNY